MRTCLRASLLFALVAVAFPLLAADDEKADPKKPDDKNTAVKPADEPKTEPKDEPKDTKKTTAKKEKEAEKKPKLVYGGVFVGKITQMDQGSQRQLTVQVTNKVAIPNPQAAQQYAQHQMQWQQRMAQIARERNPAQQQRDMYNLQMQMAQQTAQYQQQMYNYKDVTQDVQIKASDEIKVRIPSPPPEYDEKGNIKKYTAKELKALKGDESLPGYPTEFDQLHTGQVVQVYLSKQTTPPAKKAGPKMPAGPGGGGFAGAGGKVGGLNLKNDDLDLGNAPRLEAVMIVIVNDPTWNAGGQ